MTRSRDQQALNAIPILVANRDLVILNKPAGLACHAGPGGGPSVEDWFAALSRRRTGPWLAHRLDFGTSGCLVVALRHSTLLDIQSALAEGRAEKVYWAVVDGQPAAEAGVIDLPLAKHTDRTGWRMVPTPGGPPARTAWRVRGAAAGRTWLELRPSTGRTHQIRAHCAALGCPVNGDPVYGPNQRAGRMSLLARSIALPLSPPIGATAPIPAHMQHDLAACGGSDGGTPPQRGRPRGPADSPAVETFSRTLDDNSLHSNLDR